MLQRIQTIYLVLTFAVTAIVFFFFPLWTFEDQKPFYFMENQLYVVLLGLSTVLSVLSIISFKKRQNQFVMNRLNMILNLILLGLFVYRSLNIS